MMNQNSTLSATQYFIASCFFIEWLCLFIALIFSATCVAADDVMLHIKPARCVALHEGQICYQTLKFNWRVTISDTYCLYRQDSNESIACWSNQTEGAGVYEFSSDKSTTFLLMRKSDAQIMAQAQVGVAWVYDAGSHRESHWRIF